VNFCSKIRRIQEGETEAGYQGGKAENFPDQAAANADVDKENRGYDKSYIECVHGA